jgi:hypothetical protein
MLSIFWVKSTMALSLFAFSLSAKPFTLIPMAFSLFLFAFSKQTGKKPLELK